MDTKKVISSAFKKVLNEKELNEINGGFGLKDMVEKFIDAVEKTSGEKNLNYNLHHLLRRIT
ncbi:MAG: bacteriocin [Nanoarchaeota archaeon]|nr:bacteriocin [Nanoarchaeota archaeon]